ncbi:hypothetical protein C2E23DRAFT_578401 [Lenzites betulinus]|nr:hypothetical protein C2E23DRAFT_578401 [Lenzites betulinus]
MSLTTALGDVLALSRSPVIPAWGNPASSCLSSSYSSPSQAPDTINSAGSTSSEHERHHHRTPPSNPPRRRIRPKIALDPNQPLTAQGKPRARVYVACNQCRARKTRCDGAKPVCFHCRKRPPENGEQCNYEPQPKRRGQDKAPGTRSQKPPKRRRRCTEDPYDSGSDCGYSSGSTNSGQSSSPRFFGLHTGDEDSSLQSDDSVSEYDPFASLDISEVLKLQTPSEYNEVQSVWAEAIPTRPSLQFTRETWWDALITFYSSDDGSTPAEAMVLSADHRSTVMRSIVSDLRALFHSSLYWASFIHLPRFFDAVLNPARREHIQPSLVLAALAAGTLAQSSEAERGAVGRARAVRLLELADGALQASLASGWVDIGLIQATWLIAYFEMQSHPLHSEERSQSSLLLLDSLMRVFNLTALDADIIQAHSVRNQNAFGSQMAGALPFARTSLSPEAVFTPLGASAIPNSMFGPLTDHTCGPIVPDHTTLAPSTSSLPNKCDCGKLTIRNHWPSVQGLAPGWEGTLMWPIGLSEGEFRKEECRRLVWSTVMLTASLNSYSSVTDAFERTRLTVKEPRNFALLFPGESLSLAGTPVPANNVWTLYLRAMLLLHACVDSRANGQLSEADRAQFAMRAWLEIDSLEHALDQHTCDLERWFGFQAREMLFGARMCVSYEFQRYIPQVTTDGSKLFYRDKAESWLRSRLDAADRVWYTLVKGKSTPTMDYRKPLLIYWFMSHIIKALVLWRADPTLTIALEASKSFVKRTEYLMMFWPDAAEQRREWQKLRYEIVEACLQVGVAPPEASIPVPFPRKRPLAPDMA